MKWFYISWLLMILLTSCSPYQDPPSPTPTIDARRAAAQAATKPAKPAPAGKAATPQPTCTVDGGSVYLREGAGMQYAALTVLHDGQVLTVRARGAWLQVIDDQGHLGYIRARYCQ